MQEVEEITGLEDSVNSEEISSKVILPACPHCGDDPAKLHLMTQRFPNGAIGTIFFCGNPPCRKIISVQLVGMERTPGSK